MEVHEKEKYLSIENLQQFAKSVLIKLNLSKKDASVIADSLIYASSRGIDSHGIIRLPYYIERLKIGGTNKNPNINIVSEHNGVLLMDGDNGMGQVVGLYASNLATKKAEEYGISFVLAKNSSHYGAAAFYTSHIAEHQLIGMTASNTTPVMTAWGGAERVIGNNPFSIAIPYKDHFIILDIAMSRVAGGKVRYYAKNNEKIPEGWIVDSEGQDTTNPNDLPNGGSLLPFGEHKGYGLAVILELLTGGLTNGAILGSVNSWLKKPDVPTNMSQFFIAIDFKKILSEEMFYRQIDKLIDEIKNSKVAPGFERIYFPGEIEAEIKERRKAHGIPITAEIYHDLKKLSKEYNIELP